MLTKKDFEAFATAIGWARAHKQVGLDGLASLEDSLVEYSRGQNPRFDIERFSDRVDQHKAEALARMSE